jgi:threonyl-tRNA synthetase
MPTLTLPGNDTMDVEPGTQVREVMDQINLPPGEYIAAKLNGNWVDLYHEIEEDADFALIPLESEDGLYILRHSTAHLTAQAVLRLFPDAKLGVGPPIDDGFYYDFKVDEPFTPEDLEAIEEEMETIVDEDHDIRREEVSEEEAMDLMNERGQDLKLELIEQFQEGETISIYRQGEFTDLCRGPHLTSTGEIKTFKLQRATGAYWRGDERRDQMQRIYGTAFPDQDALEEHLERIEKAKQRDHRKLGQQLDLFDFTEHAPAHPIFLPNGTTVYNELIDYIRQWYWEQDYQEVKTPQIYRTSLWEQSGHADAYEDNMYFIEDGEEGVKPMNCPGHTLIFNRDVRSYRDLPIRYADFGRLHRQERSGVTHGLTRVMSFQQDDAHIFCTPDQIDVEVGKVINMILAVYEDFGFDDVSISLSTRPQDSIGGDEMWKNAHDALAAAMDGQEIDYEIDEGEGAFYGPKIDFHVHDALGRDWQIGTIQLDFSMPKRFDLEYVDEEDNRQRPVMIHRAVFGSIERFLGILIEHYGGAFPFWLAPEQVRILPISEHQREYAEELTQRLKDEGIRVHLDDRDETLSYRIRNGEKQKVPYLLIVGDDEVEAQTVSVRDRDEGDIGEKSVDAFVQEHCDQSAPEPKPAE